MKCKMMHDMLMQKEDNFFDGLCQSELQILPRNMVLFETCEDIAIGSLFKSKNETKEKVLNKS